MLTCCNIERKNRQWNKFEFWEAISALVYLCQVFILRWRNWSSHWGCFIKKGAVKYFAKLTGKHLCQSLFFDKVATVICNFVTKKTRLLQQKYKKKNCIKFCKRFTLLYQMKIWPAMVGVGNIKFKSSNYVYKSKWPAKSPYEFESPQLGLHN